MAERSAQRSGRTTVQKRFVSNCCRKPLGGPPPKGGCELALAKVDPHAIVAKGAVNDDEAGEKGFCQK